MPKWSGRAGSLRQTKPLGYSMNPTESARVSIPSDALRTVLDLRDAFPRFRQLLEDIIQIGAKRASALERPTPNGSGFNASFASTHQLAMVLNSPWSIRKTQITL